MFWTLYICISSWWQFLSSINNVQNILLHNFRSWHTDWHWGVAWCTSHLYLVRIELLSVHGCWILDHNECFVSKALTVKVLGERRKKRISIIMQLFKNSREASNVKETLAAQQAESNSFDWGIIDLSHSKLKLTPFCLPYKFSSYN